MKGLIEWLACGERGLSSNTMVTHLIGINAMAGWTGGMCYPHDPDDLGRCRKLVEQVPEIREKFEDMSSCSPEWAGLVASWEELCSLMDSEAPDWWYGKGRAPETYRRMQEIITSARKPE